MRAKGELEDDYLSSFLATSRPPALPLSFPAASTFRKLAATADDDPPCLNGGSGECTCPPEYQGERCQIQTPCADFSAAFNFACPTTALSAKTSRIVVRATFFPSTSALRDVLV